MNIFKEYTENQKRVKERIKREKEADKEKHDRMMDSARTRDTRRKNSMTESEIHVRLDHLDGDSRQKKASDVMKKHEKAGHIKFAGETDKGVIFKAKSKSHADRLHRELKPHATGVEHMSEAKSAQDPDIKDREGTQPAAYHKGLKKTTKAKRDAHFKKHGKKADDDASAYKDAPGDKKARKGDMPKSKYTKFVDNMMKEGTDFAAHRAAKATAPSDSDRKKMAKVADLLRKEREKKAKMNEAIKKTPLGPKGQAAKDHITALGKKHGRSFGDQRLHIYHYPNKYDKKTNAHAKVLDQHQFGGKTEEMQHHNVLVHNPKDPRDHVVVKTKALNKSDAMKKVKAQYDNKKYKFAHHVEETQKKDHQTISYVTHGGQKGKVQVHKDNAFKALNHYRKNNKSAQFEAMSPESRKAHGRMFKAAAKKKYDADTKAAAQAEREKRLKAKGWVKNDRGGMSKVSEEADKSLAAKAAKSGISVGTLKKVYNRGVAAWKTGHRPGTTPSQWGHARVNAFITKKKKGGLNHDKDLA